MQSPDPLARAKRSPECLSAWQRSQISLDLLAGDALQAARAHVDACAECKTLLDAERAEVAAAAYERVPEALLQAARQAEPRPELRAARERWRWSILGGLAVASLAATLLLVRPPDEHGTPPTTPTTRTKGALDLSFAVLRDEKLWAEDLPAARATELMPGDRLRLRVHWAPGAWILLEGYEDTGWTEYFQGTVPEDRWLPVGVTLTPDGETRLRLSACPDPPEPGELDALLRSSTCQQRVFDL